MQSILESYKDLRLGHIKLIVLATFCAALGLLGGAKVIFALFGVLFVFVLSHYLKQGFYILLGLCLIPHWTFALGNIVTLPVFGSIQAPVADFWAVGLFAAFALERIRYFFDKEKLEIRLPAIVLYILFLASAFLSLNNLPYEEVRSGVQYIFRFLVLLYLGYVVLGANILKTKEEILKGIKILAGMGLVAAIMGMISIPFGVWDGGILPRAVPLSLFGWAPFGDQHVFIAEAMTTTLPLWIYLWISEKNKSKKEWLLLTILFIVLTTLLTFSRAGWISLFFGLIVFIFAIDKHVPIKKLLSRYKAFMIALAFIIPIFVFFMLTTRDVYTSTLSRYLLLEIGLFLFFANPLIGAGVGSFTDRAREVLIYQQEIGGFQDAHGVIQKLLSEQGIIGFIAFTAFVLYFYRSFKKRFQDKKFSPDARLLALTGMLVVVMSFTFQLFNTHYYSSKVWIPISLMLAAHYYYSKK